MSDTPTLLSAAERQELLGRVAAIRLAKPEPPKEPRVENSSGADMSAQGLLERCLKKRRDIENSDEAATAKIRGMATKSFSPQTNAAIRDRLASAFE